MIRQQWYNATQDHTIPLQNQQVNRNHQISQHHLVLVVSNSLLHSLCWRCCGGKPPWDLDQLLRTRVNKIILNRFIQGPSRHLSHVNMLTIIEHLPISERWQKRKALKISISISWPPFQFLIKLQSTAGIKCQLCSLLWNRFTMQHIQLDQNYYAQVNRQFYFLFPLGSEGSPSGFEVDSKWFPVPPLWSLLYSNLIK